MLPTSARLISCLRPYLVYAVVVWSRIHPTPFQAIYCSTVKENLSSDFAFRSLIWFTHLVIVVRLAGKHSLAVYNFKPSRSVTSTHIEHDASHTTHTALLQCSTDHCMLRESGMASSPSVLSSSNCGAPCIVESMHVLGFDFILSPNPLTCPHNDRLYKHTPHHQRQIPLAVEAQFFKRVSYPQRSQRTWLPCPVELDRTTEPETLSDPLSTAKPMKKHGLGRQQSSDNISYNEKQGLST